VEQAAIAITIFVVTAAVSALLVPRVIALSHHLNLMDQPGPRRVHTKPVPRSGRVIALSHHLNLMDQPGPRRVHTKPVPRSGGLAVFLAFVVGVALSFSLGVERYSDEVERIALLLAGSALIVAIMLYDDALGISPRSKLLLQIGVALVVVLPRLRGRSHGIVIDQFNAPHFGIVTLPLGIALVFTVFWIVGMMNTVNWLDGLDGLASSVTLVACGVLFLHTYFWPRNDPQFTISILPLALGAALIGFLPFNWHPARIILGDTGANFLGFALAVLAIIGGAKIATALLAVGLPILDVAWVIFYRIVHGQSPVKADRGHLHHRLLDQGWSQAQIVAFVAGVSAAFGALALILPTREAKLVAMMALGLVLLGTVGGMAIRGKRPRRPRDRKRTAPTTMIPGRE